MNKLTNQSNSTQDTEGDGVTQNLIELAERCEQATPEQQRDLLIEAHLLARGMAKYVRREFAALVDNGGFLDAARELVPDELDWTLDWLGERSAAWILAARFKTSGAAITPALALCAAALKAKAQQ